MANGEEKRKAHADAQKAQELFEKIAPILFPHSAPIQGNVLSMLLGTWLAGHIVHPSEEMDADEALMEQRAMRARLMVVTTNAAFAHAGAQDLQRQKPKETMQ